jgi:hypothetical protein
MISFFEQRSFLQERDDGGELQRCTFSPSGNSQGGRWYLAYPLSTRHVEELMEERGVKVDHFTINRWVVKYSPQLNQEFHRRKRPVWVSCATVLHCGDNMGPLGPMTGGYRAGQTRSI